jgi:hypothetical protein
LGILAFGSVNYGNPTLAHWFLDFSEGGEWLG